MRQNSNKISKSKFPIFDAHLELFSWKNTKWKKLSRYINKVSPDIQFKEAGPNKIKKSNVKVAMFCINTALSYNWHLKNAILQIKNYKNLEKFDPIFHIIYSKDDLNYVLESENKIGMILYLENVKEIDKDLKNLEILYKEGIRVIQIMWDEINPFGGSHWQKRKTLTPYGIELIKKMEKLKIIVDLAHMNEKTFFDALKIIKNPPIVSHTGLKAVKNHTRNISDLQLKKLAEKGGVAGIFLVPEYLNKHKNLTYKIWKEHIKHGLKVVGEDYLGIGSDFGGMLGYVPKGLENVGKINKLTDLLYDLKLKDRKIKKILFENFIRVFKEILE